MYEELARNVRRSWLLMGAFVLVALGAGYGFGLLAGSGPVGLAVAAAVAFVLTWGSYLKGDRVVLAVSRARRVTHRDQPRLVNIVEGLAIAAGLPMPDVYVIDDTAPNAFATGRNPQHASIAVTTGLLETMNRVELEAVVAHELAHIANRDTLVMGVAATLLGMVVLVSDWTIRSLWWGIGGRRSGHRGGGPAALFALLGVALAVLMPLAAQVLRFAVGRRREYFADIRGVQYTRYPPGLISALEKLKSDRTVVATASRATGHLWIESPLQREDGFFGRLNRLFDTHPPLDDRIRALQEL